MDKEKNFEEELTHHTVLVIISLISADLHMFKGVKRTLIPTAIINFSIHILVYFHYCKRLNHITQQTPPKSLLPGASFIEVFYI